MHSHVSTNISGRFARRNEFILALWGATDVLDVPIDRCKINVQMYLMTGLM